VCAPRVLKRSQRCHALSIATLVCYMLLMMLTQSTLWDASIQGAPWRPLVCQEARGCRLADDACQALDHATWRRRGLAATELPAARATPHCLPFRGLALARLDKADGKQAAAAARAVPANAQHAALMDMYLTCLAELRETQVLHRILP
jgi:hypothetical protein